MKKFLKPLIYITFLLYSFAILHIVLLSRARMFHTDVWLELWNELLSGKRLQYGINLIPFRTILGYLDNIAQGTIVTIAIRNLLGNLLMFLPLGIYLPVLFQKCRKLLPTLSISLCILVGIELVQFITLLGSLDIDDLILNLCGILLGFGLWKSCKFIRYFNL